MTCSLHEAPVQTTLDALFADAQQKSAAFRDRPPPREQEPPPVTAYERFSEMKDLYLPIDRPFGNLLYALIRAARPQTVVEFGTSFGISTIFLAAAVRDNGVGRVIATEFIESKADTARQNFTDAGLIDQIDLRVGDATQTLAEPLPGPVDFLFLDGEKSMYLDIVQQLEPRMKPGCLIASDNTDQPGTASFLEHVRNPANGYLTTPLLTPGGDKAQSGHEISVRL